MPTHVITELRAAILARLASDLPALDWTRRYWQTIDRDALPCGVVWVPRVLTESFDDDTVERSPQITVLIKRTGGADIEDVLEADSAAVEASVFAALAAFAPSYMHDLTETRQSIDGDGKVPVGELIMTFSAGVTTPRGSPLV